MTQLIMAKQGKITLEMEIVAKEEAKNPEQIREKIASGRIVIPRNKISREFHVMGIGEGLRTKVNANIGTSEYNQDLDRELIKLQTALEAGADAVMDLSTGGNLKEIREQILKYSSVMVGTVPIYSTVVELSSANKHISDMDDDDIFSSIEDQVREGVDFITVHCGITKESLKELESSNRICGIVSRGGAILANWIRCSGRENPLYANYERLLEIAREYDVTLSLGDGLRPGSIIDASDRAQIKELMILGELAQRARAAGVQVMIEGPGHIPLHQVKMNIELEKCLCDGAPFYVLGPLTTDVAPGYDHITACIGGAIAAASGADFLCYVTGAEHLKLPDADDVREGVIAGRIAAHSGDLAKGVIGALDWDMEMSKRRKKLDWDGMFDIAMDPLKARKYYNSAPQTRDRVCTMCGNLCSMKMDNPTK